MRRLPNKETGTSEVEISEAQHLGRKFYLVNMPGFDRSHRSDVKILREIAAWLREAHSHRVHLNGIIYLHGITDISLWGFAMMNLWIFKQLCGEDGLRAAVFATTEWDTVSKDEGMAREAKILTNPVLWGGRAFRQDKGLQSAAKIVDYLISTRSSPVVLDIQREMVEEARSLDQTAAGKELLMNINARRTSYEGELKDIEEEMPEALRLKDFEVHKELMKVKAEVEERIRRTDEEVIRLRASWRELR
jgi:hypothetical protein